MHKEADKKLGLIHRIINDVFIASIIPEFFILLWLTGVITLITLKLCLVICVVLFIVMPLIFKYSISLQRGLLFLTFIQLKSNLSLASPEQFGLYGSRNFIIEHEDPDEKIRIKLGVWHILPNYINKQYAKELNIPEEAFKSKNSSISSVISLSSPSSSSLSSSSSLQQNLPKKSDQFGDTINDTNREEFFEFALKQSNAEIILYLHGNSNTRGAAHRCELYELLSNLGYHVFAFDYRGYADSSKSPPNEMGVVRDSIAIYNYITGLTKNKVFLWGHSLGTGIGAHMMSVLAKNEIPAPKAVVLESPFNNMDSEIRAHPMSKLYRSLPWFDFTIARPLHMNNLRFESDEHIAEFRQPVMILHAEDDLVVPFSLGYKLYRTGLDTRGKTWGPIEFHRFDGNNHYGHKYICRSPELPDLVKTFFESYKEKLY